MSKKLEDFVKGSSFSLSCSIRGLVSYLKSVLPNATITVFKDEFDRGHGDYQITISNHKETALFSVIERRWEEPVTKIDEETAEEIVINIKETFECEMRCYGKTVKL